MNAEIKKAFGEAVLKNDVETARLMIAQGVKVNEPMECPSGLKVHPIFVAAENNYVEMLELLLNAGADPDTRNEFEETPLIHFVCGACPPDSVKALIEAGADVNARARNGSTPLLTAALWSSPESVRLLLEAGAHVNVFDQEDRYTPYELTLAETDAACLDAAKQCRELLAAAGALEVVSLDVEEAPMISPLNAEFLRAVLHRDCCRAKAALDAGADINATDRYGTMAMQQVMDGHDAEMAKLLQEHGAAPEQIVSALKNPWKPCRNKKYDLMAYLLAQLDAEHYEEVKEYWDGLISGLPGYGEAYGELFGYEEDDYWA